MAAPKAPKTNTKPKRRYRRGPRSVAGLVDTVTQRAFARRGFEDPALVERWDHIVGVSIARHSCPERISYPRGERVGGTLTLRVENGSIAMELMHQEPLLIERINTFFGYGAIAKIKIQQGAVPKSAPAKKPSSVTGDSKPVNLPETTGDADMDTALRALGTAIASRRSRRNRED